MIISRYFPGFSFHNTLAVRAMVLLGVLAFSLLVLFPNRLSAQNVTDMRNEINRLRNDVADLQRQTAAGARSNTGADSPARVTPIGNETASAQLKVQVDQMDQELRGMTGQIEQLTFQVNQVNSRLEKLIEDMEYRLTALERGGAGPIGNAPPPPLTRPQGSLQAPGPSGPDIDAGATELSPPAVNSTL
ncbi:MAG: YbgF trimerization domain-containing protein, partial [Alphaproteobacteria bacterium]